MNKKLVFLFSLVLVVALSTTAVFAYNHYHTNTIEKNDVNKNLAPKVDNTQSQSDNKSVNNAKYYCNSCNYNHNLPSNQYHKVESYSHNYKQNSNHHIEKQASNQGYKSSGHHSQGKHH